MSGYTDEELHLAMEAYVDHGSLKKAGDAIGMS